MKINWKKITIRQLASVISSHLNNHGIQATLVGGACVSIYSNNKYQSLDLDFVTQASIKQLSPLLKELGFNLQSGRHFTHPQCSYFIDFVAPPVAIGDQPIKATFSIETTAGSFRLLTATDCVKDRLAAFFYWNDYQSLAQAVMVTKDNKVVIEEIRRWAKKENQLDKFKQYLDKLGNDSHHPV